MCLAAIYWARIQKVYYANTCQDAADIGFDDKAIYRELKKDMSERALPMQNIGREMAIKIFKEWREKEDRELY
jgi:tRNA(Arg) A34 adenosine deaminase TadA